MSTRKTPLVVDNGSDSIKAGYAKEEAPYTVLSTILGQTKEAKRLEVLDRPAAYIGEKTDPERCEIDLIHPIKNSIINDFDAMEEVSFYLAKKKNNNN